MDKATIKQIKIWHKFKPKLSVWFGDTSCNSFVDRLTEETRYGGCYFITGYFALIQLGKFSLHIKIEWWELKL